MRTIVTDEKTGVLGVKIMFRVKDAKDPNKIYHFFTEIAAYELTGYKFPGAKNKNKRLAAYVVTGKKPDQWSICHAETTASGYLTNAILHIDTDFINDKNIIDELVRKYHAYRKAGPITNEQREELNTLFKKSAKDPQDTKTSAPKGKK